jgi:hypothetical protein
METPERRFTFLDSATISQLIDEVGQTAQIYLPKQTISDAGATRVIYAKDPVIEHVLMRTGGDSRILDENGLQHQGTSVGWFKTDSVIENEAEVHIIRGNEIIVYYAVNIRDSVFEDNVAYIAVDLQKRRYEPYARARATV